MITLLFALWYGEIVLKAIAAYRVYSTRLVLDFPVLFIFLVTSTVKSTILVQLRHLPSSYAIVYSASVPVMLVLEFLCGIEIFDRLTANYREVARAGRIILALFAILAVTASTVSVKIGVPESWHGVGEAAILLDRYGLVVLFAVLLTMSLLVHWVPSLLIPANARRAAIILALYVLGNAAGSAIAVGTGGRWSLMPSFLIVATGLLAALGWITLPGATTRMDEPLSDFETRDSSDPAAGDFHRAQPASSLA